MRLSILTVIGLVFLGTVHARTLEEQAQKLETRLMATCCWSQPVSDHYSSAANETRREIRRLLSEGNSPEQIVDEYISKYGIRILSMPPPTGFNLWVYILPILALVLGAGGLRWVLHRWRREAAVSNPGTMPAVDKAYAARLERDLRKRD